MKKKDEFKIAIIDQRGNLGGGKRFSKQFFLNLTKYSEKSKIDFYINPLSFNDPIYKKFNHKNARILELNSLKLKEKGILSIKNSNKIIKQLQNKYKKKFEFFSPLISGNLKKELEEKLKKYDLAIFLWPYLIDLPKLNIKKIIILHDFNFKYYFGGPGVYNETETQNLEKSMNKWIKSSYIVVTSNFMLKELKKFYPYVKSKKISLIRMGPFTNYIKSKNKNYLLSKYKIKKKYIICPTNDKFHKNIQNLIKAFYLLQKIRKDIQLVITGPGTKIISGISLPDKVLLDKSQENIIGLGYVSDQELDELISMAEITVNQSLYEPGNGSGLDSWYIGTPVAMSNIPSFREHIVNLNVKAELFDPQNPLSIFKSLNRILNKNNLEKKRMINLSKKGIEKVSWRNVIKKYLNFIYKNV